MARTVNKQDHARKRDEILDAAMKLIFAKGYERMTIQDILADLRISSGAFYHYFDSKPAVLEAFIDSKGNKQKVGLVIALQHRPELLVLDEPTSGLDPLVQQTFYALIREAKAEGRTVFLSSHILREAERSCDRVGQQWRTTRTKTKVGFTKGLPPGSRPGGSCGWR